MNWQGFFSSNWYSYLDEDHQALVRTAVSLMERQLVTDDLEDYSFIVFLMAKVYEAFLKKYLFDSGLISDNSYHSKRFRIGRALNPDVRKNHRDKWWLYDDIVDFCGEELGDILWKNWLEGRNRVVHSFPGEKNILLSLDQVEKKVKNIVTAMEMAQECAMNK
ncbi:MAG: hypothetical protein HN981_04580 [Candidatus Pacebacteria bacterium]|jgi:hypothetical protein|nr:hypothetical protein [Candidatus Paceibacterota bacterium]MBT4652522.1 hypothetical protein [Candidatus Paceibacterota bacterium]MBT6756349.1 hypothetical protein [Candidatus Paceibacterota bacterium]MBT6921640.1 hypothetical protein [Candidatus Paceibacterota bacterium]